MLTIYSTGQVARLLDLRAYQIEYAHSTGRLAEPTLRFLNKRLYTPEDVRRVSEHFGINPNDPISSDDAGKEAS